MSYSLTLGCGRRLLERSKGFKYLAKTRESGWVKREHQTPGQGCQRVVCGIKRGLNAIRVNLRPNDIRYVMQAGGCHVGCIFLRPSLGRKLHLVACRVNGGHG